jgi:hypothetical protein
MEAMEAVVAYSRQIARTAQARGTVGSGIAATGTTQADAQQLYDNVNVVSSGAAKTGVILQGSGSAQLGDSIIVANIGSNTIFVYPPTSGKIDTAAINLPVALAPGRMATFLCVSDATSGYQYLAD